MIDYFIRNHPDQSIVQASKIADGYEKTNIWRISPARDKRHPAVFPRELAEKVIRYYSFENDVVLDPFAGIGTTAKAAVDLHRRFVMIECLEDYILSARADLDEMKKRNDDFEYKFFDYSDIKEDKEEELPDLYEMIRILEKMNVSRNDIAGAVYSKYKEQLEGAD